MVPGLSLLIRIVLFQWVQEKQGFAFWLTNRMGEYETGFRLLVTANKNQMKMLKRNSDEEKLDNKKVAGVLRSFALYVAEHGIRRGH